jgi:hypothetical protein
MTFSKKFSTKLYFFNLNFFLFFRFGYTQLSKKYNGNHLTMDEIQMTVLKETDFLNHEENPNEIDDEELVIMNEKELWKFNRYFWDDKIRGYDLLNQNLRNSLASIREFERYIRECSTTEDQYLKQLNKNVSLIEKFSSNATMSPIWFDLLRSLNENTLWSHMHYMNRLNDLIKEIHQYYLDMRMKKRKIKENEYKAIQIIENFKTIKLQLNKSKDQYHQLVIELEKLKQNLEINQQQTPVNQALIASLSTNITKLDKKILNATEEYKTNIEKYNELRREYEQRFIESCDMFQQNEEEHLNRMRTFLMSYFDSLGTLNQSRFNNHQICSAKLENKLTVEYLIQKFISIKSTGQTHPRDAEFIEYPDTKNSQIYSNSYAELSSTPKYDRSDLSLKIPDPFDISESNNNSYSSNNRKRSDSRFSLFNIDFRGRTKSKKYNTNKSANLMQSTKNSPLMLSPSESAKTNSFQINSKVEEAFDQQLIQLNNFEHEMLNGNNTNNNKKSDSIFIMNGKKNSKEDQSYSFNESSTNITSNNRLVGSLKTATSLENFYNDINSNNLSNKNLNRLDSIDDSGDLNYFPAFDDLEVEKNMNKNTDMNNLFDESNFSLNELSGFDRNNKIKLQPPPPPTPISNNLNVEKYSISNTDTENYFEEDNFSSDTDSDDSDAPKKILVKINPLSESIDRSACVTPDILNQITKSLQLNISNQPKISAKSKRYNYKKSMINIDLLNNQSLSSTTPQSLSSPIHINNFDLSSEVINLSKSPVNANAPPLPPLPAILQQKVKEKKALFNQQQNESNESNQASTNPSQTKSDPIDIYNDNLDNNIVKISRQNSFKFDSNSKKMFNIIDNTNKTPNGSIRSFRLNMKLPGEEEIQF